MRHTSVEAYRQIQEEGLLSQLQWEVYDALYKSGPLTQGELWSDFFHDTQRHNIAPRCAELEKLGVIRTVGKRPCRVTGRVCLIWDVTDGLPTQPERKEETLKRLITDLQKEVEAIKQAVARLQSDTSGQGQLFGNMKGH